ncbi:MAG TPA: NADP-dependent oxidoreductase [Solirubrobacteraceae bacterium]|jgi:NADPH:quinone reductase-like Zn-dependent oxidoreductase
MSRAVRFDEYGGVDVLKVVDVDDPVPGAGQVLVRVKATSINPGEAKIREGALHDRFPATFPSGEGSDVAGVIEAVGPEVDGFEAGDEVIGWNDERSAHAELVVVERANLTRKPPELAWEVAGALFVAGATAWAAVRAVGAADGDTVVVAGAAGGVGVFTVQLAAHTGARVIGLASERHHDWLRAHGVVPVAYGDSVAQRIREAAPDGVDAFIDLVGVGYVALALDELGVAPDRVDTIADFEAIGTRGVKGDGNAAGASAAVLAELAGLIVAGELEVPIEATFPLEEVVAAYEELAQGHTRGKIVLLP